MTVAAQPRRYMAVSVLGSLYNSARLSLARTLDQGRKGGVAE